MARTARRRVEPVEPVEVESPVASPEAATETGVIAGVLGGGISTPSLLDAMVVRHWRRVVRAAREPAAAQPRAKVAGTLPKGAKRS